MWDTVSTIATMIPSTEPFVIISLCELHKVNLFSSLDVNTR